jgi:hypothetical protein
VLDDKQAVDKHDAAISDDEKPTFEVAGLVGFRGPSPTLLSVLAEPGADDGKSTRNSPAQYNTDSREDNKEERGEDPHADEVPYNDNLAYSEGGGDGIGSDAPASVGLIHDVFAEYERTFSMSSRKQKRARSALNDCQDSDTAAGSIPRPISHEEPLGVTSIEQPAEAASDDASPSNFSRREPENGSTSRPRQGRYRQGTETDDVRSMCLPTFAGDCRLGKFYTSPVEPHSRFNMRITESAITRHTPSLPRMAANEATRSDHSAVIQEARTRKRSLSSTGEAILPDDSPTDKRPRRATKETWKAREAREKLEAKRSQASDPCRKKQALSVDPNCGRGEVDDRVADMEDVYLGEDGSIQCVVTWKSSLVAMENLSGELQRRSKELFRERYGHRALQKRATIKQQTQK